MTRSRLTYFNTKFKGKGGGYIIYISLNGDLPGISSISQIANKQYPIPTLANVSGRSSFLYKYFEF
jgi:hypothetical protein